jgi:chloramphenicol 3-O phosphotransferase
MVASLDVFINMLPKKAFSSENIVQIINRCESGFLNSVAALASAGNKVIVDTVLDSKERVEEFARLLQACHTVYVGVHCPLEELERREKARGDREIGLAKHQFSLVHLHARYDIEVDTREDSPDRCAARIAQHLNRQPR